jgi:DNA-binding NarL/FixJ family response regulator
MLLIDGILGAGARLMPSIGLGRGARMLQEQPTPPAILTERQREIARLLSCTGLTYKEVAARLHISEGTMRKHAENVYRRLGVHSRAELMIALSNR